MKVGIRTFLVNVLILYLGIDIFGNSIHIPTITIYLIITFALLSLTMLAVCPFLNFLTVKCNFVTYFLMSFVLLVGVFYLLNMFMIDFSIDTYTFQGIDIGTLEIKSFEVTPIISIIVTSLFSSFLSSFYKELDTK